VEKDRLILFVLILACAGLASLVAYNVSKQISYDKEDGLQREISKLIEQRKDFEDKVNKLERNRRDLESELGRSEKKVNEIMAKFEREKQKDSSQYINQIGEKDLEIRGLEGEIERYKRDNKDIKERLAELKDDYDKIKEKSDALLISKENAEGKIRKLERELEDLSEQIDSTSLGTVVIKK